MKDQKLSEIHSAAKKRGASKGVIVINDGSTVKIMPLKPSTLWRLHRGRCGYDDARSQQDRLKSEL